MTDRLSIDEVRHVANLARLALTDAQLEEYQQQLADVLEHVGRLDRLALDDVEPLASPRPIVNRFAEDEPVDPMSFEKFAANAPRMMDRYIAVPKVIGESAVETSKRPNVQTSKVGRRAANDDSSPPTRLHAAPPSITAITHAVRSGERSATDIIHETFERIRAVDAHLHCFLHINEDAVMEQAAAIDERVKRGEGEALPLAGVPVAIKDNIVTEHTPTTAGSRMLEGYRSPFTATAVRKLLDAGAIILGKTSCDAFGMGSSGEHCDFGITRNPWLASRVPGGSSSGSAAAIAAGLCPIALGSDTGGSIRQPASFCGVVGVKPSYGRVSRWGLIAFGSSLEQIGPFAANVADAALVLQVMAGHDPLDSTSADEQSPGVAIPGLSSETESIDGLRVGVPKQFLSGQNDKHVARIINESIETFRSLGANFIDLDMPLLDEGLSTYYIIATAEASSNLARYDGIRYGHRAEPRDGDDLFDLYARSRAEAFGPEVQRRIMLGTYVLSAGYYNAYYKRALQARRLIKEEFDRAFSRCDAIIGPTSPTFAFGIGEKSDPLSMYLSDVYTVNTNIAGHCAISVPAGFAEVSGASLPVGLQIQCSAFAEAAMFRIAHRFEQAARFDLSNIAVERATGSE